MEIGIIAEHAEDFHDGLREIEDKCKQLHAAEDLQEKQGILDSLSEDLEEAKDQVGDRLPRSPTIPSPPTATSIPQTRWRKRV